jgi:hypothetical protein
VSWVTQLVVHPDYRGQGIARKLCHMAWGPGGFFAAGLITSHPHAVKALEGATQRECDRALIEEHAPDLVRYSKLPYVQNKQLCCDDGKCLIDTQFFVDHTEVERILSRSKGWQLGPLEDGKEFMAFTFAVSPRNSLWKCSYQGRSQQLAATAQRIRAELAMAKYQDVDKLYDNMKL